MYKYIAILGLLFFFGAVDVAFAQEGQTTAAQALMELGPLGIGLTALGGGLGIGRLAASALESIARQPEMATTIAINMLIAAALIEGFVFFGIFMCT